MWSTVLLLDDCRAHKEYHTAEEFTKPLKMRGNMAAFKFKPIAQPREKLKTIIGTFARHFRPLAFAILPAVFVIGLVHSLGGPEIRQRFSHCVVQDDPAIRQCAA